MIASRRTGIDMPAQAADVHTQGVAMADEGVEACFGQEAWPEQGAPLAQGRPLEGSDQKTCPAGGGGSAACEGFLRGLQALPCEDSLWQERLCALIWLLCYGMELLMLLRTIVMTLAERFHLNRIWSQQIAFVKR